MKRDIKLGSISWIAAKQSPIHLAGEAAVLRPDWIPKTYVGLKATSNPDPADSIGDFKAFRAGKNFRSSMYCHISVDIDDATGKVNSCQVKDSFYDPGWTPPFDHSKYPSALIDPSTWGSSYHAGEASGLSGVYVQAKHPNTNFTISVEETVLINGLVKFRAGKHTDDLGVNTVKAKFHVPWVWCEMALTYKSGQLKFYGRGSVFPTHAWYLDGKRIAKVDEAGDSTFPPAPICTAVPQFGPAAMSGRPGLACVTPPSALMSAINVSALNLYKVLSKGVPSSSPQSDLASEKGHSGIVTGHPNTVEAGKLVTQ